MDPYFRQSWEVKTLINEGLETQYLNLSVEFVKEI